MTKIAVGGTVPDFQLGQMGGAKQSLTQALKKGPVALAFFKVSCPICQYALPFLERIHQTYGNDKVTLWGISQDDARDTKDFCTEFGLSFPMLLDEDGYPVSNDYAITNVPTLILVGTDGKARVSVTGFSKKDTEAVAHQFAAASGKPPTPVFRHNEDVPDFKPG